MCWVAEALITHLFLSFWYCSRRQKVSCVPQVLFLSLIQFFTHLTFLLSVLKNFQLFSRKWNALHRGIYITSFVGPDVFPGCTFQDEIWAHAAVLCTQPFLQSEGRCDFGSLALYWILRGQNPGPPHSICNVVNLGIKLAYLNPREDYSEEGLGNRIFPVSPLTKQKKKLSLEWTDYVITLLTTVCWLFN